MDGLGIRGSGGRAVERRTESRGQWFNPTYTVVSKLRQCHSPHKKPVVPSIWCLYQGSKISHTGEMCTL